MRDQTQEYANVIARRRRKAVRRFERYAGGLLPRETAIGIWEETSGMTVDREAFRWRTRHAVSSILRPSAPSRWSSSRAWPSTSPPT